MENKLEILYQQVEMIQEKLNKGKEIIETPPVFEGANLSLLSSTPKHKTRITSIQIPCLIKIKNWELNITALVDSGSSNSIISEELIPEEYHTTIPLIAQYSAESMTGDIYTYTKKLSPYRIGFYNNSKLDELIKPTTIL